MRQYIATFFVRKWQQFGVTENGEKNYAGRAPTQRTNSEKIPTHQLLPSEEIRPTPKHLIQLITIHKNPSIET